MTVAELRRELATVPQDLEVFCDGCSIQDWIIYNFQCDGVGGRYVDLMAMDGCVTAIQDEVRSTTRSVAHDDIAEEASRG